MPVTKTKGGKITGLIALTMEASYAAEIDDAVHVSGDYTVALADGSKPVLGLVSVPNKGRVGSTFPAPITNGGCTVEARCLFVRTVTAGTGGVTAGALVKPDATGRKFIVAAATDIGACGIALMAAAANGKFDLAAR